MYHLYVDETGHTSAGASNRPGHRYLSLSGVVIADADMGELQAEFDGFRTRTVGHTAERPFVLHRTEMNSHKGLGGLLKKRGNRSEFEEGFIELVSKAPITVFSVTMDKVAFYNKHEPWVGEPYEFCAFNMIERFCLFLFHRNASGKVSVESRNPKDNERFEKAFNDFRDKGTRYMSRDRVRAMLGDNSVATPTKGSDIMGCQLADFLCQPLLEACIRKYRGIGSTTDFHRKLIHAAWPKLYRGKRDKVDGCGLVWRPK